MATTSKKYEVVLNAGALGLRQGDNIREVSADRFERDPSNSAVTFYEGDEEVAFFQHVFSITVKK